MHSPGSADKETGKCWKNSLRPEQHLPSTPTHKSVDGVWFSFPLLWEGPGFLSKWNLPASSQIVKPMGEKMLNFQTCALIVLFVRSPKAECREGDPRSGCGPSEAQGQPCAQQMSSSLLLASVPLTPIGPLTLGVCHTQPPWLRLRAYEDFVLLTQKGMEWVYWCSSRFLS